MLTNWALYRISDGFIDNVIALDPSTSTYTPADGYALHAMPADLSGQWSTCGIGWSCIGGVFIEPPNPNPEPTP